MLKYGSVSGFFLPEELMFFAFGCLHSRVDAKFPKIKNETKGRHK